MVNRPGEETISAIQNADELADLSETFGTNSVHETYFRAKKVWKRAMRASQEDDPDYEGIPGRCVRIDGTGFHVHGVTHAGTEAEREFLREHVETYLDRGAMVLCEQGIRPMYFSDFPAVWEMDDYLWARHQCEQLDTDSDGLQDFRLEKLVEDVASFAAEFQDATYALIDSTSAMYSKQFERALGDIVAEFLSDHADLAVGKSYEAFTLSDEASENPDRLIDLQQYYERTFLPQPLEREWLRLHDPELELVSHARNERIADYAVYHSQDSEEVHLIVGAAHQPGVVYYLEEYQKGREIPQKFELF